MAKSSKGQGQGDLDTVVLRHPSGARAEVYLFGGTLCSYKTPDGKERIFVSPGAKYDGKKAIRGGVPLVFPQFGQPDKAMPQHGFARTSTWTVHSVEDTEEESRCILTLSDSEVTREVWKHEFKLEYEVVLSAVSLTMTLRVINTGDAPFSFQTLLHTYFQVEDIEGTAVRGLAGRNYIDKVADGQTKLEEGKEILLPSFTDRVYLGTIPGAKDVTIATKSGSAVCAIVNEAWVCKPGVEAVKSGDCFKCFTPAKTLDISAGTGVGQMLPCDVVVWNPYEEASPGDLPPPAFKEFVCVEPGLVGKSHDLPPKGIASLCQKIIPV